MVVMGWRGVGRPGQRPRVTPQLSNKSCSLKVLTLARHSVWLSDTTVHLAAQEKVEAELNGTTLYCNNSLHFASMQKKGSKYH